MPIKGTPLISLKVMNPTSQFSTIPQEQSAFEHASVTYPSDGPSCKKKTCLCALDRFPTPLIINPSFISHLPQKQSLRLRDNRHKYESKSIPLPHIYGR